MRITGHRMLELATSAASAATGDVAEVSQQITSGHRVAVASDDPVAWAQARRAEVRAAVDRGRGDATNVARADLVQTEDALTTIGDAVAQARALAVQGGNDTMDASSRRSLGVEVRNLYQLAWASANRQTSGGEYLLAGSQVTTAPFDAAGAYQGDTLGRTIERGEGVSGAIRLTGDTLTAAAPGGGVDILPALDRLATALAADDLPSIQTAIGELETATGQISRARGDVGAMVIALDDADTARATLAEHLSARVADLTDTDVVAAAGQLTRATTALEASQAVSARLAALLSPRR